MARLLAAAAAVVLLGGACRGQAGEDGAAAPDRAPVVYVAVGASDSVGVGATDPARDAWPEVFRRQALPDNAVLVNLGVEGSNVAQALADQVPRAVAAGPALATVWLNVNDIVDQVPPQDYERQLQELVHRLRRDGATKVLVANTPEVDQLPVVARLGAGVAALADRAVEAYNQAIARVVAREGAVLVDLHAASLRVAAEGRTAELVSADGFHPNTAGYAEVAEQFARALEASGGL